MKSIGVGRFRILGGGRRGGQGLEYWGGARFRILGGQGGPNSKQAHAGVLTSMRRNVTTSHRRHFDVMCPLGF